MAPRRKQGADAKSTKEPAPKRSRRDEKAAGSADEIALDGAKQDQEVGRW